MKKALWITTGFLLFINGFLALVLMAVGVKLSYLTWIDKPGPIFGFIIRILMIVGGIITVYLTATDWRKQDEGE
jgi:hypothetical protein